MKQEIFAIRAGHFLPAICFLIFSACAKPPPEQREFALGTVCGVNLYEYGNRQLYSRIFARIREIERTMSARQGTLQIEPTDLMKINENAGIAPVKIPRDLFEVLERAKYYAQISGGAFDPTIGPLVNLWGIGTEQEKVPTPDEISDALSLVNWRDLLLESGEQTAYLRQQGMSLDLGAIAKGYAADEAARIAGDSNAKRGIIDLGGNILVIGGRGQTGNTEAPWRIGVQNPLKKRGTYIGALSLRDRSVVTSGIYERNFVFEGKVYHHILSVKDGYPVNNGLLSVTIVAENSIDADSFSTAVFALGFEEGMSLIEAVPNTGAIFVFDDKTIYVTSELRDVFVLTDNQYTLRQ